MAITIARLHEALKYEPETGVFTWLIARCKGKIAAGDVAGCVKRNKDGTYIQIAIDGRTYLAHRLAWFYIHGSWPAEQIDHKNGVGADNRLSNLREATPSQNGANKKKQKSARPYKGVALRGRRWRAAIVQDQKPIFLGTFPTPELAHAAYAAKARELFGSFARAE